MLYHRTNTNQNGTTAVPNGPPTESPRQRLLGQLAVHQPEGYGVLYHRISSTTTVPVWYRRSTHLLNAPASACLASWPPASRALTVQKATKAFQTRAKAPMLREEPAMAVTRMGCTQGVFTPGTEGVPDQGKGADAQGGACAVADRRKRICM